MKYSNKAKPQGWKIDKQFPQAGEDEGGEESLLMGKVVFWGR